jgi:hypothetical protein
MFNIQPGIPSTGKAFDYVDNEEWSIDSDVLYSDKPEIVIPCHSMYVVTCGVWRCHMNHQSPGLVIEEAPLALVSHT